MLIKRHDHNSLISHSLCSAYIHAHYPHLSALGLCPGLGCTRQKQTSPCVRSVCRTKLSKAHPAEKEIRSGNLSPNLESGEHDLFIVIIQLLLRVAINRALPLPNLSHGHLFKKAPPFAFLLGRRREGVGFLFCAKRRLGTK